MWAVGGYQWDTSGTASRTVPTEQCISLDLQEFQSNRLVIDVPVTDIRQGDEGLFVATFT